MGMLHHGTQVAALLLLSAGLSSCGEDSDEAIVPPHNVALERPIASDLDLALSNDSDAALGLAGGSAAGMPRVDTSPATIARIREAATRIVGGNQAMRDAPPVSETRLDEGDILTLEQRFVSSGLTNPACARRVSYGGRYAATMPQPFALYPESALQDAAGFDGEACVLRGAVFRTPISVQEVLDFYFTRAAAAGYEPTRLRVGDADVLLAQRGNRKLALYLFALDDGVTQAELLTVGR